LPRKVSILLVFCLIVTSVFMAACSRKDQASNEPAILQNPVSPALATPPVTQAQVATFWVSFADTQLGVASSTDQAPISSEFSMYASVNSALSYFYDPLDGSSLGSPNILGYGPGFLGQSAIFGGNHYYIQYGAGSQIPNSGPVEFYLNIPAYQPAYNGANIIFTQPGYGGAAAGDIHLALTANNSLAYGQWGPGWHYQYSPPLPMGQWVKIRAEFGSSGKNLYFNDQLVCSDPSTRIPISARPFYFGTRAFYGPEYGINGNLDEVISFSGIPVLKIVSPTTGSGFDFGQAITFVGEQTPPLFSNLQWTSSINSVFGQGLTVTTSNLSPGTHTITLTGQFKGSQVSDSITINVQEIAEIKIKNLDAHTGEDPFASSVAVSYKAAKTRFQAIGYRSDHTEIGPVSVDWSLEGGVVSSLQPIRLGILDTLGVSIPRIGNINGNEAISNSSVITFNSYLSGVITLQAQKGLKLAAIEVRIKQPTAKLAFKIVRGVGFDLATAEFLANKANEIWSAGGEKILTVKVQDFSWLENQAFESLPPDISSEYLLNPNAPSYLNPLVVDILSDQHYGLPYNPLAPKHVVPRQPEEMLKFRTLFQKINVYLPKWAYARDSLAEEVKAKAGMTVSSRRYYEKTNPSQLINDGNEGGIFLTYADQYLQDGGQADINQLLAHEIGHVLGLNHINNLSYLMHDYALSTYISPAEYVWALDYLGYKSPSSVFVTEE